MKSKHKNIIYVIGVILLLVQVGFLVTKCKQDECTKTAFKQKVTAGMVLKSTSSKSSTAATDFVPHTQSNPYIMDWMRYDSIANRIHACATLNDVGEYVSTAWVGFPQDIYIHDGDKLSLNSVNCVVQGNIHGEGTVEIIGCPSTLVVQGLIDDTINQVVVDGSQIIVDVALGEDSGLPNGMLTVQIPCDWPMNEPIKDENGVLWIYTEYK